MTKLLNLDEMLEVMQQISPENAGHAKSMMESLGTMMAREIGRILDVVPGEATAEGTAFAGTCASFRPSRPGQPCPSPLDLYDEDEWDDEGDEEIIATMATAGA